jgi:hypothetical protein
MTQQWDVFFFHTSNCFSSPQLMLQVVLDAAAAAAGRRLLGRDREHVDRDCMARFVYCILLTLLSI